MQQFLKKQLLERAGITDFLRYDDRGKPFLIDGRHVSITHFGNTTALVLAPFPVGLDGETPDERLLRVRHRFLHADEKRFYDTQRLDVLVRLWTAKEAVYKWGGHPGLSFAKDIFIYGAGQPDGFARVKGTEKVAVHWFGNDAVFCLALGMGDK